MRCSIEKVERIGGLLLFILIVVLTPGCDRRPPVAEPADVSIFFTSDTSGRLVPCGCFSGQYGGLTRLKTVLDAAQGNNAIRVDVGNAIRGVEDYNVIEYKYLLQAYSAMRFDALNLGQREAQLPADDLRRLKQESPVTLISANLLDNQTGAPIFDRWKIVQRGNYKVALLGVMDSRMPAENLGRGLSVEPIDITLGKVLPDLRRQADVIVLMAFTDEATLHHLAQEYYELDMIVGGKVSQPSQKLEKENRSLLLYTANEGRALGMLKATITGKGKVTGGDHQIRLLEDRIAEDPTIQAMADQYREEVRRTKLAVDDPANLEANMVPGVKLAAGYVGSQECINCHQSAGKVWQDSAHAGAMATLVEHKADADPNCIRCHTVGFGAPTGYRREFAARKLTDVGCESCHGPGSVHVAERQKHLPVTFRFRPLGAGDCQKCHFGEFSRPFAWETFWAQIKHGNEPAK